MHYEHTLLALLQKSLMGEEPSPLCVQGVHGGQMRESRSAAPHEGQRQAAPRHGWRTPEFQNYQKEEML